MRYIDIDSQWKKNIKRFDVCWYKLTPPVATMYKTGKILVKFTKIESGINIYLNGGTDTKNMTTQIISGNEAAKIDVKYELD